MLSQIAVTITRKLKKGWLVGCRFESNCPLVGPGTICRVPSVGDLKIKERDQMLINDDFKLLLHGRI